IKAHEWAMARALLKGEVVKGELVECEQFGAKRRRFFLNNAAPVRDAAGRIVAGVVAEMDVTDLKRAEEALGRHRDELERLVEERTAALMRSVEEHRRAAEAARQAEKLAALGQLTGGVAHDINNILQVVSSGAQLLKRPAMPDARRTAILEGMIKAGQNARELTGRLLAVARKQPLKPEAFDVAARLEGMSELLRRTLGPRIEVAADLTPGLWRAHADPSQLEVAILNLAVNARDAMPEGGALTIQARNVALSASAEREAGEYVCIAVKDTGQGIPPHLLARVFEPFFTTKKAGKGTGLGLSQVHGFVTQSGGDIHVESETGRGTAVFFHLPRSAAGATAAAGPAVPPVEAGDAPRAGVASALQGVGKAVLVVEDNPDVAALACSLLEELGYATACAEDAAEALAMLADGARVDAVFSDVVLPGGINGVELAAALRSSHPRLAVVLATGYSESLAGDGAPEGVETLRKPYRQEELAAALGRAVARCAEPLRTEAG
ncbi:MAG: response regulator, partial [Acetobacteraceae bacterium]|nr:response regulator [Acetobacteraceae bacterium]